MPVCPECRTPYDAPVVACRTCRVPLVDPAELGPEEAPEWVELVPLRDVPNGVIAALWKGALESQGLHPVVRSHAIPAYGEVLRDWTTKAWGSLLVPADEHAEAMLVLDDFLATAAAAADDEPELDDRAGDP